MALDHQPNSDKCQSPKLKTPKPCFALKRFGPDLDVPPDLCLTGRIEVDTMIVEVFTLEEGRMGNVTAKQLKQRTGEIIRRVKSGERLTVTYRGRPVAVILPPGAGGDDRSEDLRPFEQAWREIEASLQKTEPKFKNWREAMRWARKELLS